MREKQGLRTSVSNVKARKNKKSKRRIKGREKNLKK